jgi:hypothetical protein
MSWWCITQKRGAKLFFEESSFDVALLVMKEATNNQYQALNPSEPPSSLPSLLPVLKIARIELATESDPEHPEILGPFILYMERSL